MRATVAFNGLKEMLLDINTENHNDRWPGYAVQSLLREL